MGGQRAFEGPIAATGGYDELQNASESAVQPDVFIFDSKYNIIKVMLLLK